MLTDLEPNGEIGCPSHTARKAKRYRYYVTHPDKVIDDIPAWRLPAFDIEKRVIGALIDYLDSQQVVRKLVGTSDAALLANAITRFRDASEQIRSSTFHRRCPRVLNPPNPTEVWKVAP